MVTRAQVGRWVRCYQEALKLHEWEVCVECVPLPCLDEDGRTGRLYPHPESMTANMVVATDRPGAEVRGTILHEILHLATADVCGAFNAIREELSPGAWDVARRVFEAAEERLVIRLTRAIGEVV